MQARADTGHETQNGYFGTRTAAIAGAHVSLHSADYKIKETVSYFTAEGKFDF
jgi:ribonuclease PH